MVTSGSLDSPAIGLELSDYIANFHRAL